MLNAVNIHYALGYLKEVVRTRLINYLGSTPAPYTDINDVPLPNFESNNSPFYDFIADKHLSFEEFIILLLALAPHIQPNLLTSLVQEVLPEGGDFPEFGGVKGTNHRGILPTGETVMFILAHDNYEKRFAIQKFFEEEHIFYRQNVLSLEEVPEGEPILSGRIVLAYEYVELFTTGHEYAPKFGTNFPAKKIVTRMTWDDLVLNPQTFKQIEEIRNWVLYHHTLMTEWEMAKKLKPGYRALFYGPPGTGKTFTAGLLGKYTHKEVYKIDLSMVVSKYIGETEKNLSKVFAQAEHKNWILFFDEADSIFGKRTNVQSSNDKYANQEVSFLLQRIEDYDGLVILASNLKSNIDNAFLRRFHSVIHFPMPDDDERLILWKQSFPKKAQLAADINLRQIALNYELSGALIMNVVQHVCLKAIANQTELIQVEDIVEGIQKEFYKQGKTL